jgi:hypothetical protein
LTVKEPFRVTMDRIGGKTVLEVIGLGGSFVPAEEEEEEDEGSDDAADAEKADDEASWPQGEIHEAEPAVEVTSRQDSLGSPEMTIGPGKHEVNSFFPGRYV